MANVAVLGAPTEAGTYRRGCIMGPAALRTAGLIESLRALGHTIADDRDLTPDPVAIADAAYAPARGVGRTAGWVRAVRRAFGEALRDGTVPILLGGDHSIAAGSLAAIMDVRPETHVVWLDAHPDFNTLTTTTSGNLHGIPVAIASGLEGADLIYGAPITPLDPHAITMIGIRSVDPDERALLTRHGITVHDMRDVDEFGMGELIRRTIRRAGEAGAPLHVSLDVDFLDPDVAPAVGTTVPGGATVREAHLAMELLHESGRVASLDIVELNPFLDERGRTATLMVDLAASLFGRTIMDRPTKAW
ncbi:arginase [Acuticoccus sp. I52.16.1]|uniref:arginase n=1 Tax=Acuticoccus sp. I52.16.1 TaxID=2928472 RepID=UPI001FD53F66|nr:arginase [Acuticoccus sp. I52.16.1]UOM33560.1 arginase [Acuticoccus sp. I52.16.1]